jgi:hypothetical protein
MRPTQCVLKCEPTLFQVLIYHGEKIGREQVEVCIGEQRS